MKNYFLFMIFLVSGNIIAQETDRKIPTAEIDKLAVDYKYDNGAFVFNIKNNSSYVLSGGAIKCITIGDRYIGSEDFQLRDKSGRLLNSYATEIKKKILPGKSQEMYVEKYVVVKLGDCYVADARGRKPGLFDIF